MFDSDNIGKVNSMEFIREFFKMGKQERTKIDLTHKLEMEKIENHQKKQREERLKKFTELACVKVASTWTKEQEKSAFKKIAKLSVFYDDHNHELEVCDYCCVDNKLFAYFRFLILFFVFTTAISRADNFFCWRIKRIA